MLNNSKWLPGNFPVMLLTALLGRETKWGKTKKKKKKCVIIQSSPVDDFCLFFLIIPHCIYMILYICCNWIKWISNGFVIVFFFSFLSFQDGNNKKIYIPNWAYTTSQNNDQIYILLNIDAHCCVIVIKIIIAI